MIRPVAEGDVEVIQTMIRELAQREERTYEVETDDGELREALFGKSPIAFAFVAVDDATGQVIGYTLWSPAYGTWHGTTAQVDDIYVRDEAVGQGYEALLLGQVARVCAERGYRVMQWWGLTFHTENTAFYRTLGADYDPDLAIFRISGDRLAELAKSK